MGIQVIGLAMGHKDYNGWHSGPNSAGGVGVSLSFRNTSSKTIKYAIFRFVAYNSVGDIVADTISGDPVQGGKYTGFVNPNSWAHGLWENLWYNRSISRVGIKEVILQYSDGTEETIPNSNIEYVQGSSGCYVATAIYGSYDCPQVWTLRRYRDYTLAETWYGRAFIRTYYAISPTLVKWFGEAEWFKKLWKPKLDKLVKRLNREGVENTPYRDRVW